MKLSTKIKVISGVVIIAGLSMGSIVLYNTINNPKMDTNITEAEIKSKTTVESQQDFIGKVKAQLSGELIVSRNEIKIVHSTTTTKTIPVDMYDETIPAKAEIVKYGSGIVQYNYITDLNKAEVTQEGNDITIKLLKPYLDESSVKLKNGSFKLDEKKSSISVAAKIVINKDLLNNTSETFDGKATRILMDEIPKKAIEEIDKTSSNFTVDDELINNINNKLKDIDGINIKVIYQ